MLYISLSKLYLAQFTHWVQTCLQRAAVRAGGAGGGSAKQGLTAQHYTQPTP